MDQMMRRLRLVLGPWRADQAGNHAVHGDAVIGKVVGEGNYAWTKDKESAADKNKTFAPTIGLMLFF